MKPIMPSITKLIGLALLFAPRIAAACSSCFSGRSDETRVAFIATTAFLSAFPLLLIGSLVWWLRRRSLQLDEISRALEQKRAPSTRT